MAREEPPKRWEEIHRGCAENAEGNEGMSHERRAKGLGVRRPQASSLLLATDGHGGELAASRGVSPRFM